jgi:hypothetical protein
MRMACGCVWPKLIVSSAKYMIAAATRLSAQAKFDSVDLQYQSDFNNIRCLQYTMPSRPVAVSVEHIGEDAEGGNGNGNGNGGQG